MLTEELQTNQAEDEECEEEEEDQEVYQIDGTHAEDIEEGELVDVDNEEQLEEGTDDPEQQMEIVDQRRKQIIHPKD